MSMSKPNSPRMPLLMPDDFSELHLTGWRVENGTLDPRNPLLEGDMPWDDGGLGIHGSVIRDPIDGLWKAYLVSTPAEEFVDNPEKPWASRNAIYRRMGYFESTDGMNWSRPELDIYPYEGHKKTNIVFDVTDGTSSYASLIINPDNTEWPYEMYCLHENSVIGPPPDGYGYYRYQSKDGKRWEKVHGPIMEPMNGDLSFFYKDPDEGYMAYYRLAAERQENDHVPVYEDCARRSCFLATSKDGNTWVRDEGMSMTADERDHRDTQYQECVPLKVEGGYLALVTMYLPITQTLNIRMAASRDGRTWWYPDRRPCLDNAPLGDYGGGMIWQSQNLIPEGDQLHMYYGGCEGLHRQVFDTRAPSVQIGMDSVVDHGAHFLAHNAALCRASWRYDRMYALAPSAGGPTLGMAVTKERKLGGKALHVNVVTRPAKKARLPEFQQGALQVELLDSEDRPISGFTRTDCAPIVGDYRSGLVTWEGGDCAPESARKAKFYLNRAFLYGFEFIAP